MSHISFGKAKLSDALRISVLLKTVYIETYAVDGVTFEFANFISERFSTDYIKDMIQSNPDRLIIAYYKNNPIGVAEIIFESRCPIRQIDIPELSKLYVLARFYGKGVGYGLLEKAEELVKNKGFHEFNLEVYKYNERAIAFYKRQGYQTIGETDFPMEVNTYKNLVMNKSVQ